MSIYRDITTGIVTKFHKSYAKEIGLTTKIESYIQFIVLKKTLESISYDYRRDDYSKRPRCSSHGRDERLWPHRGESEHGNGNVRRKMKQTYKNNPLNILLLNTQTNYYLNVKETKTESSICKIIFVKRKYLRV